MKGLISGRVDLEAQGHDSIFTFCHALLNKTKDTLVPSVARDFRAQGKDCNLISLKLAIKILIAMTNC